MSNFKIDLITNKAQITEGVNPNDEFYTPEYAVEPILKYLNPNSNILCPFDTADSNYVKILRDQGHSVTYKHILKGEDFFKMDRPEGYDYIISNPPYSKKTEVLEKLFNWKIPFAMLLGVAGIFESKTRFSLFRDNEFEVMYFNKRISYFKDYTDQKPSLNPPFSSVYITHAVLPERLIFEEVNK